MAKRQKIFCSPDLYGCRAVFHAPLISIVLQYLKILNVNAIFSRFCRVFFRKSLFLSDVCQ